MRQRYKPKPGEFRLIRPYTMAHNIERLHKHVAKLQRRMKSDRFMQIMRLKRNRDRGVNP